MAQTAMTVRMDNQQKAQFDKLCEQCKPPIQRPHYLSAG